MEDMESLDFLISCVDGKRSLSEDLRLGKPRQWMGAAVDLA